MTSTSRTSSTSGTAADPDGRPVSVLIADDQRLVRAGFRVILAGEPGITVVGEASDGLQAIELAAALAPAVVLMDIRMPNMDGLAAARRIIDSGGSRVLILTTFDADEYVYEALKMGASGFLLKDAPPDQLIAAVRCSAAGDALIDPSITRRLIGRFAHAVRPAALQPAQLKELTQRELDVLRLVARGLTNAEIAAELVVEESTVKTHVSRILMKLALRDRVQAVVVAYESGFVRPDAPLGLATVIPAPPVPDLEPAFDVTATLGPLEDHGTTRVGHRRVVPIAGGLITGLIEAEILPGGADWQVIRPDGAIEIDTRYSARTAAGEYVHFRTSGVRSGPPEILDALLRGEPVDPAAYYFRVAVYLETSAPRLAVLQRSIFVASAIRGADSVRYTAYRVT